MPERHFSHRLTSRLPLALLLLGVALLAAPGRALEVDQFLAWTLELEDARGPVNEFVRIETEAALASADRRGVKTCEKIPPRLFRRIYRSLLGSRLRRFLHTDPKVDRHPASEVGYWEYLRTSLYRRPAFPFIMPLSRTVNIDGIHIGTDKLEHFFGMGRRYYKRYLRALARGMTEEEAQRRAIRWGMRFERVILGGWADGVYSHADLEANYRGMLLARDLCAGESPHLERTAAGWRLRRPIDLAEYVNPDFDETFNNNHYVAYRWKRVRGILEHEVCPVWRSEEIQARMRDYRRRAPRHSLSREMVDEFFGARAHDARQRHSLAAICAQDPGEERLAGRPTAGGRRERR